MEDILNIIILILVAVFSLIGSLAKKRKMQAERAAQASPSTQTPGQSSSPWEEFSYDDDVDFETETSIAPPPAPHTNNTEHGDITNVIHVFSASENAGQSGKGSASPYASKTKKVAMPQRASIASTSESSWFDGDGRDFDIEAGVIYSEILKPKFEEEY